SAIRVVRRRRVGEARPEIERSKCASWSNTVHAITVGRAAPLLHRSTNALPPGKTWPMFPHGALRADRRAPLDLLRPKARPACFCGGTRAGDRIGRVRGRARSHCRIWLGLLLAALFCSLLIAAVPAATTEKYDWITRCGPVADGRVSGCSVTVTFG